MRLSLRRTAVSVAVTSLVVGGLVVVGVSYADPCAPGAATCSLPTTSETPSATSRPSCRESAPSQQDCSKPGNAEIHSTPDPAHEATPPLTVEQTKPAPTAHWP
ncbi:hypothetical protein [Mycobacteroides chelonae]|uniref:hypothetical protein n=1 Tax=Mycobacteroides chelonae TaxID=1774 RepID=UPI00096A5903|nr:hypothetical protein [Mycobacteroides chelonae]MBF9317025.1 hypothetical protein [Mycobacteroides chelonae]MBF9328360.1 hypothetical protein [Mycobacteroides chelonae]MBF9422538.1 hypothetical protein [Mycobacteroides chelonae]MBV6362395.1 hypothetical protein [Mycobacteroides chelonae]MEC4836938.1 hypothetical protein [Mycobacteroides chelonae]